MNIHKNARLTLVRRLEMVRDIVEGALDVTEAADVYGVTAPTVRKWLGRYLAAGESGLLDRSSRPAVSPRSIDPKKALTVIELRRKRLTQARIAAIWGSPGVLSAECCGGPGCRA
jgi:transposase-like protein